MPTDNNTIQSMCKVFLIQYSRAYKTINAQQSVHRNVPALEYLGKCSELPLSVCCESVKLHAHYSKSIMHQSMRGANTNNTTIPEHVSLSMEIIVACSPCTEACKCVVHRPCIGPGFLGFMRLGVYVSLSCIHVRILQCTLQHLVDYFRWNSSLSLFLASIMNRGKARQFSLSQSVHSLI